MRVLLIGVLVVSTGLVAMPQSAKEKIPISSVREFLLEKDIHYGLDLAGGSQLDFIIDLSRVRQKIAEGEEITEEEVVNGVKATLERRIDPDGTRELNVYTSDFGEEKHIFVELTADIDNAETRAKLEKHIDLQFKEPKETPDESERKSAKAAADEALALAQNETAFLEIEEELNDRIDSQYQVIAKMGQEVFEDQLPEEAKEDLWNAEPNTLLPNVYDSEGDMTFSISGGQVVPQTPEGFSLYRVVSKDTVDRTRTEPGEDFDTVAQELSEDVKRERPISELPNEIQQVILTDVQPNEISEVFEYEDQFALFKLLGATEESGGARVAQIITSTREEADAARERVTPNESVTQEEQLIYDELFVEIVPEQWIATGLDGQHFRIAKVATDQTGLPVVSIEFTDDGAKKFEDLTARLVGKPMAIFVGGEFISAPIIQEKISGGSAQISFGSQNYIESQQEAIQLSRDLNAGAIPAPVELDGELKVAPSLGREALDISIKAGLIGLGLLSIWLIFAYRLLGVFAVLALLVYAIILVGILKLSSLFVLTLAGIAGIILSIGLAVDANVLIFERIREELRADKNFSTALAIGFDRAWTSIRDANLTTLIVCGILYVLGTSIIKGFATMLAIGVLLSMFTALTVTRTFLRTLVGTQLSRKKDIVTKL
jgi:protein-export membrane protein SecD